MNSVDPIDPMQESLNAWHLPALVDLILVILVIECLVLVGFALRGGRRRIFSGLVAASLAGLGLLIALRLVLAGVTSPGPVALCLALSGIAHVFDLRARLVSSELKVSIKSDTK